MTEQQHDDEAADRHHGSVDVDFVSCDGCGRRFLSQQSLGSHIQHCDGGVEVNDG